ncbi:hypothetical protein LINPERPRIM_LOCUS9837 [Linum perenne]
MLAIKGSWVGRTYAISKSNESGGRKARIRRSKEERKGMTELFIKKYQSSHNGNFPSLTLTQKEVGGTFYTVREIVREIIQENRVLGPAKLLPEDQDSHEWQEQYPLGTIATEPQSSSTLMPDGGNVISPDECQSLREESSSTSHDHVFETQKHKAEADKNINGSFVIVGNVEFDQQKDNEVAPTEDITLAADEPSVCNTPVEPVFTEVEVSGSLGNQPCSDEVGNAVQEITSPEVRESCEQIEAEVGDQAIGIRKSANEENAVIDNQVVAKVQDMETEKSDNEVAGAVLPSPSLEFEASKEQGPAENVVKEPEDSVHELGPVTADSSVKEVGSSRKTKVFQTEDVVVETFPLRPIISRTEASRNYRAVNGLERTDAEKVDLGTSKDGSNSSVVVHQDEGQKSFLGKKPVAADEQLSSSPVTATVVGSDSRIGVEVKSKLSNDQASSITNVAINSTQNNSDQVSDNKGSQNRKDPTVEKTNISWQGPLKEALQAIITALRYQSLHNGNFPSLTLTQKEVGGTFYTVREIVREIIQENRVLGPARVLPEDQDSHEWSEQYPLAPISTEPQSSSILMPDEGNLISPDQCQSLREEFSSTSNSHVFETQTHKAEAGKNINGSFVIVGNVESLQWKDNEVAPTEDMSLSADPSVYNNTSVKPVFTEVEVGSSLGNQSCYDEVENAVQEISSQEVRESYEQTEAEVEDQVIGIGKSANEGNAVIDNQVVSNVQGMETEESDSEVTAAVLCSLSSEVDASKEQIQAENVVKEPEDSVKELGPVTADNSVKKVGSSRKTKVFQTEDVVVETFPLRPIISRTDASRNYRSINGSKRMGPSKDGSNSSVVNDQDEGQKSLLGRKSVAADEQPSLSPVAATVVGSYTDSRIGVEAKPKLSNDQVSSITNVALNSTLNNSDQVSDNKDSVERSRDNQNRKDPTLERINIRSWQLPSKTPSPPETNLLQEALQSIIAAFVKFWKN